jgi:predicted nucleotidyltransferase
MPLSPEAEFQIRKAERRLQELEAHRSRLLASARAASRVLRQEFGAERVWLFGSLRRTWFRHDSDIDLAVEGMDPARIGAAWDRVLEVVEAPVDLVCLDDAPDTLCAHVRATGEVLP